MGPYLGPQQMQMQTSHTPAASLSAGRHPETESLLNEQASVL